MKNEVLLKIDECVNNLPEGALRNTKFTWKKHRSISMRLAVFCVEHEGKVLILSSIKEKIGLDYKLLVKCLWFFEIAKDVDFQFIYDQDYKEPIGDIKDILVKESFLKEVLRKIGFEEKVIEDVVATAERFSLTQYEDYVINRERQHNPDKLTSFEYLEKMELYPKLKENYECEIIEASIADSIRERVRNNQENPTDAEQRVKKLLDENNIKYEFQYPVRALNSTYILDFYFPEKNVCIEIDGDYHNKTEQVYKDKLRDIRLSRVGVFVARFHNSEIFIDTNPLVSFLKCILGYKVDAPTLGTSCMYPIDNNYVRRRD
jgi:very-short-patch-repair endonuclease